MLVYIMSEKYTDCVRRVFQLSKGVALRDNHDYIDDVHLFYGFLSVEDGTGLKLLKSRLSIDPANIILKLEELMVSGPPPIVKKEMKITERAVKIMERAVDYRKELGHQYFATIHLGHGLLTPDSDDFVSNMLVRFGITNEEYDKALREYLGMDNPKP
jgi:ATP-dependent Clp protease ATP-binding subunit ClpA